MTKSRTYVPALILAGLALTWGSSFILIKQGLKGFDGDSSIVGGLRIVITFLVLLPIALRKIRKISKRQWIILAMVGIIGNLGPAFLFAYAQIGIDSNMAGILNSLTPLFTLLIGLGFFKMKTKWFNILGVMAGLSGAIGLIHYSGGGGFIFSFQYAIYVVIATICYATSVNIIKSHLADVDVYSITAHSFFIIGIPTTLYLILYTNVIAQLTHNPDAWAGLGYISILAVAGTAVALLFFNSLIKMTSALFASSVTYLIPIVAIIWGIIDGEVFTFAYVIWILLILGGVYLVNVRQLKIKKKQ